MDATDEDQRDRERDGECGVDGHLGSTKAAGETDEEFVLRAGRYDVWKDKEWRKLCEI